MQARRRYPEFLRSLIDGAAFFPLELRIGKTRRAHSYGERAAELTEFHAAANALGLTVEWREVSDPRFGLHKRPERAFFADEGAYLEAIVKGREVRRFREDVALIRAECPALGSWLSANVAAVIRHHGVWPELLRVVRWFRDPSSLGIVPHDSFLSKACTPNSSSSTARFWTRCSWHVQPEMVDAAASRFEARHGLRWEQPLVRLRFLDPLLQIERGFPTPDVAVPAPRVPHARIVGGDSHRDRKPPELPRPAAAAGRGGGIRQRRRGDPAPRSGVADDGAPRVLG